MKFRKNKKAMQLSINMLVVIILAIVIFGFGVSFLYSTVSKAFKLKGMVDEDLDTQMETILCDKPVCLSSTYKKIYRKEFEIVGLRIYNTLPNEANFRIVMTPAGAFDKEGADIPDIDDHIIYIVGVEPPLNERTISLTSRTEKGVGIGIEIRKNAPPGTYVFNIIVKADGDPYPPPQQIRIEVP